MTEPRFSFHLKLDYRGGGNGLPFWQRYWQRIFIAVTVAAIWFAFNQI